MKENIIVLDVINLQGSSTEINQACSDLTNSYYSQLAQANTAYTLGWGSTGGNLNSAIKLIVGGVEYLVSYDASGPKVHMFGSCDSNEWNHFQVSGNTVLHYSSGSFQFTTTFELINSGTKINITVEANTETSISACE